MNYDAALDQAIGKLHDEGRYRTFIDIERRKGAGLFGAGLEHARNELGENRV